MKIKSLILDSVIEGNLVFIFPAGVTPKVQDVIKYQYNGSYERANDCQYFKGHCRPTKHDRYVLQRHDGFYIIIPLNPKYWEIVDDSINMSNEPEETETCVKRPKEDLETRIDSNVLNAEIKSYLKKHLKVEMRRAIRGGSIALEVYVKLDKNTISWDGVLM